MNPIVTTKEKIPIGLKIFASFFVLKSTIPTIIASIAVIYGGPTTNDFFSVLRIISGSAYKMLGNLEYSSSLVAMSLVISIGVLGLYFLFITNKLNFSLLRKKIYLQLFRVLIIIELIPIIIKFLGKTVFFVPTIQNTWLDLLLSAILMVALLIYFYFNKNLKNYFLTNLQK